jgi:photosystem II stability/assembly factor-like uncharacterized protein
MKSAAAYTNKRRVIAEAGNTKVEQIGNIATNYGPLQPVLPSQTTPLTPVACGPDFTHYEYFKGCRTVKNATCNIPQPQWTFTATSLSAGVFKGWYDITSSADCTKLAVCGQQNQIYTSTDFGVTWTPRDSIRLWRSISSSADGTKLVAAAQSEQIYTSTESGVTWIARDSNRNWRAVASSADGTKLVAAGQFEQIYTSTDSGATWTPRYNSDDWYDIASSVDGTKLAAVTQLTQLFLSSDSGVNWTPNISGNWRQVASSADGTKLVLVGLNEPIRTSTDSGATWTTRDISRLWQCVASSADGTILIAGAEEAPGSNLYVSTDSGVTWNKQFTLTSSQVIWRITCSSDGKKVAFITVTSNGLVYTGVYG